MAGTGGARHGAGRRLGVPNKANALKRERAAAEGPLPSEIMLKAARFFDDLASQEQAKDDSADAKLIRQYLLDANTCAHDAAPYYESRLSTVTVEDEVENKVSGQVSLTDKDLDGKSAVELAQLYRETLEAIRRGH